MIKNTLLLSLFLIITLSSCEQKATFNFKHSEKEQVIQCDSALNALLNEALYVFESDIQEAYKEDIGNQVNVGYARFLYVGFAGTAEYDRVASQSALEVHKALMEQNILIKNGFKSNLNYKHPAVQCIINNIEDVDLANTIKALVDTNTMDPKLFATRMRNYGRNAIKNRYAAMYIALDTYYQQLDGVVLAVEPEVVNE